MKIVSFGSLNIDLVYQVPHIVRPGETLPCKQLTKFCGGKGLNQTAAVIAAAQGRVPVYHAGCIGNDGAWLVEQLDHIGADSSYVRVSDEPTGHAIIQLSAAGENAIVIHGGANRSISPAQINDVWQLCTAGDTMILQNEINALPQIIAAAKPGVRVCFNAAPCDTGVREYPLELLDTLLVNEVEGAELAGSDNPKRIVDILTARYPQTAIIVTIGDKGALYGRGPIRHQAAAYPFRAVDTTAAGDTFAGYYAALTATGSKPVEAMRIACCAASLAITKPGALPSIPAYNEVARHL